MLLDLQKIAKASLTSVITGREGWLSRVYDFFCPSQNLLTGIIKVSPQVGGEVRVAGDLRYDPVVYCSRCGDEISWPLKVTFTVYYRKRDRNGFPPMSSLSKDDLDVYYYYDDDRLDLAELVNEQVQLAIPDKTVPLSAQGNSCQHCQMDLRATKVYNGEGKAESPFAVLKNFGAGRTKESQLKGEE